MQFQQMLHPVQLRHKTLKNRVVFGAHTANMAESGLPGPRHLGYYLERAKGGAAMIVVEPVPVHRTAVLTRGNLLHSSDAIIEPLKLITDACHAQGTVMIQQLYHVGQHGDFDNSYEPSWSPSGLPSYHDADGSHAMNEAEIMELVDAFAQAALRAQKSGFDGVELYGAYNGLLEQFWLPWSNRRTDQWGGTFDNRMRFVSEVITSIRKLVGEDFIIGINASVDSITPTGMGIDLLCEVVAWYDSRKLIDYVSCGTGGYFNYPELMPTFFYADKLGAPYAESLKKVVKHALVQAESHIRTPENANYLVASGQSDLVSIVRGQIADPHLVRKTMEGRPEDVRGCISCNQMCWGRRSRDYWISCMINPSAGREFEWGGDSFVRTSDPKKVLVVGGGPAGLEAARVAAERGHQVTLTEASPLLGGSFRLAGLQPRRSQITELIAWYERQLLKLNVEVRLNSPMDADDIQSFAADEVVMATGSLPSGTGFQRPLPQMDKIKGVELPNVWAVEDVMGKLAKPVKKVIVVDDTGDWRGGGTALQLAESGLEVTIVTGWPLVGFWIQRTTGDIPLRSRLKKLGVQVFAEAAVTEWRGDAAVVRNLLDGSDQLVKADTLVLATTNESQTWLSEELTMNGVAYVSAGDCVAPRLAVHAIYEGRSVGMRI